VLDLNPNTKTSDSKDITVTVGTNNITGYKLNMSTTGDITSLTRDSSVDGKTASIPTLGDSDTTGTTAADLTDNRWGYKLNNTGNFIPYVSGVQIMEKNTATNADTSTLSFASKINYSQAAGSYAINLNFTGVTNPLIHYIQNLDPALCTTEPMTVVDNRDNQEYVVQRLADGNCWMMTNLNLGAVELTQDLTSENTNLATAITAATFNGWKKSSPTMTYTQGIYTTITNSNSATGSDTDPVSNTKYGTLYNFCALTGGDSRACINNMSGNMSPFYDICPAGWRIPILDEFSSLYGYYNSFDKMRASIASDGAAFTLEGWFGSENGGMLQGQSTYGSVWSSTASNRSNYGTYYLRLDTYNGKNIYATPTASNVWYAYNGRAIRCILK